MRYYATCGFGMEALVRDELRELGIQVERVEDARVFVQGEQEDAVRANLWLRCADRVFLELGSFPAETFDQLFEGIRAIGFGELLPFNAELYITGKGALSKLVSVRDMQSIGKKAVAESMMAHYGYARCPETGPRYNIEIGMLRDVATIGLNLSGGGLNRRGYRDLSAKAPIRETLAAALVYLSHYDGREILLDPFCGSGTIAIEAAMIASNTAPGLMREFAFDSWSHWRETGERCREEARDLRRERGFAHIHASDIDPKMVSMTQRHGKRAGVNGFINAVQGDVKSLSLPSEGGVIVTNPPYGVRMEVDREAIGALGRLKEANPRWGVFAISEDRGFERSFGARANKRRKLYNGSIRCDLYMYFRRYR